MGRESEGFGWGVAIARGSVLLLVAAAYMPARVYAANPDKFPHPERVVAIVGVYWLVGCAFFLLMSRLTRQPWAALSSAAAFALLIGSGGSLASRLSSSLALLVVSGLSIVLGLVLSRFSADAQRFAGILVVAIALSGPVVAFVGMERYDDGQVSVAPVTTPLPTELVATPDVFVILWDGFPGDSALENVYQHEISWSDSDEIDRFEAWTSYPVTLSSVAAMFEMGQPLHDEAVLDSGTRDRLAEIISGDNRLYRLLSDAGYEIVQVESGWSRSYCDESIDVCVASPFVDEGIFEILHQSAMAGYVARRYGSGMTEGAFGAIEWMADSLPRMATNDRAEFVFASVVMPHPPLMLDAECRLRPEGWRAGNSLYVWDGVIEQRRAAFLDQTECAAKQEMDLLSAIPEGPLVVFLSDHGGDSTGQLSVPGHVWSDQDVTERMNVHMAIRSPYDCPLNEPVFLSAVIWSHLWCMAEGGLPEGGPDPQMFIADRIAEPKVLQLEELSEERLRRLGVVE